MVELGDDDPKDLLSLDSPSTGKATAMTSGKIKKKRQTAQKEMKKKLQVEKRRIKTERNTKKKGGPEEIVNEGGILGFLLQAA